MTLKNSKGVNRSSSLDGISTYNFHWQDMDTTSFDKLLQNVRTIDRELARNNKILVHCHAGRGRTGTVISCILIYRYHLTSQEAIKLFQTQREGTALEKSSQQNDIRDFEAGMVL
jgi:protein-tyrosine phosphatase